MLVSEEFENKFRSNFFSLMRNQSCQPIMIEIGNRKSRIVYPNFHAWMRYPEELINGLKLKYLLRLFIDFHFIEVLKLLNIEKHNI